MGTLPASIIPREHEFFLKDLQGPCGFWKLVWGLENNFRRPDILLFLFSFSFRQGYCV
jgi:hypothetical protein